MTNVSGGDTIKSNAMSLLRAIYDRTNGTDQPVFVEELGPDIGMEISVIRSTWRYLAEKELIKTFSIPLTARINARGIDLIEDTGHSDRAKGGANHPPAPTVQHIMNVGTIVGSNIHQGDSGAASQVTQAVGSAPKVESKVRSNQLDEPPVKARGWSRGDKIAVVGVVATVLGLIIAVLPISGLLNNKPEKASSPSAPSISAPMPTASSISVAANGVVPVIDVKRFCGDAAVIIGAGVSFVPTCIADEQKAKQQLAQADFPSRILSVCNERFSPGLAAVSYRRLWMCAAQIRIDEARKMSN